MFKYETVLYFVNKAFYFKNHSVPFNLMSHEEGLDDRQIVETNRAELMRASVTLYVATLGKDNNIFTAPQIEVLRHFQKT